MSVKDKLGITLITYNRKVCVQNTLNQLLSKNSPVREFDILVLDNCSTDGTDILIKDYLKNHSNLHYERNARNIGIGGNIAKAIMLARKEYQWTIGDDDYYDFSNWSEVEDAINRGESLIACSRYVIELEKVDDLPTRALQMTFITGGIVKTSNFNNSVLVDTFVNIYTVFPHMVAIFQAINRGDNIYLVSKSISTNGSEVIQKDKSYYRGRDSKNPVCPRTATCTWSTGYAGVCTILNDKKLRSAVFMRGWKHADGGCTVREFLKLVIKFHSRDVSFQLSEICSVCPGWLSALFYIFALPGMGIVARVLYAIGTKLSFVRRKVFGFRV